MGTKETAWEQNAEEIAALREQVAAIKADMAAEVERFVAAYDKLGEAYGPIKGRLCELYSNPGPIFTEYLDRTVGHVKNTFAGIGQSVK